MVTCAPKMDVMWEFSVVMCVWFVIVVLWDAVQPASVEVDNDEIDVAEGVELVRARNGIVGEFQHLPVVDQHRMQQRGDDY